MKNTDLMGIKFNKLIPIKYIGKVGNNCFVWECVCDCGKIIQIPACRLKSGHTKSCGCWKYEYNSKVGSKHEWAEIIEKIHSKKKGSNCFYLIKCKICDQFSEKESSKLVDKKYKSCGCVRKREAGFASANDIFLNYLRNAKKRKLDFEITFEDFFSLSQKECEYCGEMPKSISRISTNGEFIYNGIDRINNLNGYIKGNLKTCCKICNRMKMDMTMENFIQKIMKISKKLNPMLV